MPSDPRHDGFYQANRLNWDERVSVHEASPQYDRAAFLRNERPPYPVELAEIGDVAGRTLLHLQCHFGMDTLGWARLGARVTGIDFSGAAIEAARRLSSESRLPGRFIEANLYDAPAVLDEQFDIVYVNIGALNWLPDVRGWASVVAACARPGGILYLYEVHPMFASLDPARDDQLLVVDYPYFETLDPIQWDDPATYTDGPPLLNSRHYEWNHGLGEIVTAIIDAGFRLDFLHEHMDLPWRGLPWLDPVPAPRELWRLPERVDRVPMMFSLKATRFPDASPPLEGS
ncbi:MAG: class I SAM-dependent methyltransferase [Dehalococcoidia bacterium]